MKKRSLLGALLCSISLAVTAVAPTTVWADATKVVTLGADLSDSQKNTMLKYFKVNRDEVQILYVTNSDERQYLSAYVPSAQIGSRTVSCAYVKPTKSGGIKVRTANLNYVTCNMIATTLSTSGVTNCEVVAACPFEVSGTGALTGIMMAYEKATGEELDPEKKDIATHEMVVTGNLATSIESNKDAINIINSGKMEVVGNDIQNADEIYNVVVNIMQENNVEVSQDQLDEIVSLLEDISKQDYDYEEMKETLENVEGNVTEDVMPTEEPGSGEVEEELYEVDDLEEEESILDDLDTSALGEEIFESSTEDPTLEEETGAQPEEVDYSATDEGWEDIPEVPDEDWDWDEPEEIGTEDWEEPEYVEDWSDDSWDESEDWEEPEDEWTEETETEDEWTEEDEWEEEADVEEADAEDEYSPEQLDDMQRGMYDHLVTFCKGEFEGDLVSLQFEMGEEAYPAVVLSEEVAERLTNNVLEQYLKLLIDGTIDYMPEDDDPYMTAELNILMNELKETMNLEGYAEPGSYLEKVSSADRQTLYDDLMKFYEKLYGESLSVEEESWNDEVETESYDAESYDEESYDEESYDEESYDEAE